MKFSLFVFTAAVSCTPQPQSPLTPDASDASARMDAPPDLGSQVCAHLNQIGCPQPPTCAKVFNTDQGVRTDFHTACLMQAATSIEANLCKSVLCTDSGL